jgi:hypothetical protein
MKLRRLGRCGIVQPIPYARWRSFTEQYRRTRLKSFEDCFCANALQGFRTVLSGSEAFRGLPEVLVD